MKTLILSLCLFGVSFLTSCLIPETSHSVPDYFLLTSREVDSNQSSNSNAVSFYVKEVRLPHYLLDKRLVSRPTDDTIVFRENQRWGEPLEIGVGRVLSQNLGLLLDTFSYGFYPQRRKFEYKHEVEIFIERFEFVSENSVKLKASWGINKKGGSIGRGAFEQTYSLQNNDVKSQVRALSNLLFDLSNEIARMF